MKIPLNVKNGLRVKKYEDGSIYKGIKDKFYQEKLI